MKDLNIPYIAGLVISAQHSDSDAFAELYALTYLSLIHSYEEHIRYLRRDLAKKGYRCSEDVAH